MAVFDGPARAIKCAEVAVAGTAELGFQIKVGVHTGEVHLTGQDVAGLAVHIGARIAALAQPSEILVSRTVRDLVSGAGLEFIDRSEHKLKGIDRVWQLFAVTTSV